MYVGGVNVLHLLNTLLFGVLLLSGMPFSRKLFGGKFTAVIPYLFAGIGLLFAQNFLLLFLGLIGPNICEMGPVIYMTGVMQIIAGFFFLSTLYHMYQMEYALRGFIKEEVE